MENYIILHQKSSKDLIFLNPKFIESVYESNAPGYPNGTIIYCLGRKESYWVAEDVEEVCKKVWGTI